MWRFQNNSQKESVKELLPCLKQAQTHIQLSTLVSCLRQAV